MKVTDFYRLKKLMGMTQSDNDQEALTAIRKANEILKLNDVNWDRVFSRLVTVDIEESSEVENRPAPNTSARDADKRRHSAWIDELLDKVEETATGDFINFVASLRDQWNNTGHLTPLQIQALQKSAARSSRR